MTGTVVVGSLSTSCAGDPSGCYGGVLASCEQLRAVARVTACRDDAVQWLHDPQASTEGPTLAWNTRLFDRDLTTSTVVTTGLPADQVGYADGVDPRLELDSLHGQILIPPRLVPDLPADASATVLVLAEAGRDLAERLSAAGIGSLAVSGDVTNYDFVGGLRETVWALAGVVLAVGMLGFGLGAVDRAVARRREVVRVQLLGVPAKVIRRSQWLEAAVPIGVGSVLAVALGMLAGGAYLSLVDEVDKRIPWAYVLSVIGASALAAVAVAGLTIVLAATPRIRPEHIRPE